jgi:hypothetical protein
MSIYATLWWLKFPRYADEYDALHSMDRRMLAPARRIFSKSLGAAVLSGLYPKESEEKRLLDALLPAVPRSMSI